MAQFRKYCQPSLFRRIRLLLLVGVLGTATLNANALNRPTSFDELTPATETLLRMAARIRKTRLDCSHFIHELYNRVGLTYSYIDSRSIFKVFQKNGFRRAMHPLVGDLIVWRGHMGIVVNPEEHTFLSAQRTGVKVDSYQSQYWKGRGQIRFYRYDDTLARVQIWQTRINEDEKKMVNDNVYRGG